MERSLKIYENRKIFFGISIVIILIGLVSFAMKGLNYGIEFKGGSIATYRIGEQYNINEIRTIVQKYDTRADVREIEGYELDINSQKLKTEDFSKILADIKKNHTKAEILDTDFIGPTAGKELTQKALISSALACVGILLYVSFRFKLRTGMAAVIALVHDVLVTIAVYAVFQVPVNSSFIAAILTILGYSINDTIVIFDRIRENEKLGKYRDLPTLTNASITQTMARSINTMMTTLFTITAVYLLGVPAVKEFAFPLIIGIISGGYSSIFVASPLWVELENRKKLA